MRLIMRKLHLRWGGAWRGRKWAVATKSRFLAGPDSAKSPDSLSYHHACGFRSQYERMPNCHSAA
ncbi:hypothetical protein RB5733 [Rhodopirellula baltica SH 1]|uniref:Uncharacterized protein n=1 Tax=Rhodopirellula baltica (strain DSM 10527 / NCIMB 13988 / SH1) TaxID=243090 RepID=Q7URD7_RHOBA|nr:hypothetical protein RB5733 [Rhodopirellula baltica SH 1]